MDEKKKKKKKKQRQIVILKEKPVEIPKKVSELIKGLEELEKEQKHVDIQICPRCKSHRIHRVGSMIGDMSGHMGLYPPKFECLDCGWRERLVMWATNKKLGVKDVAIIAEAIDSENLK
jgi:hypothetical protein